MAMTERNAETTLTGSVENVVFTNPDNHFTVIEVNVAGGEVITAVGVIPEVSEFDDHEIHIEEHLRYILQMDFQVLKYKKPEYAEALENHLRQHKQAQAIEEQSKM